MHRKIRTSFRASIGVAAEKIATLHVRAIEIGERARQMSGAAYAKAYAFADRKLQGTRLEGRTKLVGLAAASVLAAGFVGGTAAIVDTGSPEQAQPAVVAADARVEAAERADRAERQATPAEAAEAKTAEEQAAAEKAAAEQAAAEKAAAEKAAAEKAAAEKAKKAPAWVEPMPGAKVTSCFGPRWGTQHQGIDFGAPAGTEIRAVGAGRVVGAGWLYTGYGISVVIDHGNGYLTHYAHASKAVVKEGQKVKPGQVIAHEGSTGDSTGPHLHFEVHKGMWNQINPAKWLSDRGVKVAC